MSEKVRHNTPQTDVCLAVPPFDSIMFPALGVSVLAASLQSRGLTTRIVYGSLLLASRMGAETYRTICNTPIKELLGERLFVPHAYPPEVAATLGPEVPFLQGRQELFEQNLALIGPFVETFARQILETRPKIVGITSNFQQNMASVALARRIKQLAPDVCTIIGGANAMSPMGDEFAEIFPWIDYVFSGEADTVFPDFCEAYLRQGGRPLSRLIRCAPITDMRVCAAPDFTDYFSALRHFQKRGQLPTTLPEFITLESSRGCWWGEKNHCTFCGLNGDGMGFRKKSSERVYDEIRELTEKWKVNRIHFSDNIMPLNYFDDLLPKLAEWPQHPRLFFEVKANLKDEHLRLMAKSGVDTIQPGIESLSSHVLKLMRKGVSALQNVALLRSARSVEVTVVWNMLYGLPGESREDYEATLWLMPRIEHLYPPSGLNRVIIDRFSPYHFDHEKFGIATITPFSSYAAIYPAQTDLSRIAYHFGGDFSTPLLGDEKIIKAMHKAVADWIKAWERPPRLDCAEVRPGHWIIIDTRRIARKQLVPVSAEAVAALTYFERPRPRYGGHNGHDAQIDALLAQDFLIEYEGSLLSLVTRGRGDVLTSAERNIQSVPKMLETAMP